jgi:hypothetical protein
MAELLARQGFGAVRAVSQRESVEADLWRRTDSLRPIQLSVLAHAVVAGGCRSS